MDPFLQGCEYLKMFVRFKRLDGVLPSYLNDIFVINSQRHSRDTRYCNFIVVCPKCNRETERGKTFRITSCKLWNMLPLYIKKEILYVVYLLVNTYILILISRAPL